MGSRHFSTSRHIYFEGYGVQSRSMVCQQELVDLPTTINGNGNSRDVTPPQTTRFQTRKKMPIQEAVLMLLLL